MLRRYRLMLFVILIVILMGNCFAAQPPAPRVVELTAPDKTKLKATYFAAGKTGPGVLLFHQCNRDRTMWSDIAPKLAAKGMNVLTLDFRGFGESGGTRFEQLTPADRLQMLTQTYPKDVDVAYEYLVSQPGVNRSIVGAAGASCGVNQAIQLARRHPEVKSLVLLSGTTDRDGRLFLKSSKQLPIFGAAADDDQGAVEMMKWILSVSPDPANRFQHYQAGGHGIEMFAPHPELTGMIVDWFDTTLVKTPGEAPVNKNASFRQSSVLSMLDEPGGAAKVSGMLDKAHQKDPKAALFSEPIVNVIGYEHLQSGDTQGAIELFKLNVAAFPDSPNTYDSLSDAYLAAGQNDLALRNAKTAIKLLETDTIDPEPRRNAIRESAEQKVKQLTSGQH